MNAIDRRLLGHVEVDSGTLVIGDPVYLLSRQEGPAGIDYKAIVEAPMMPSHFLAGLPVLLLQQFGGDGSYPVYGDFDEDQLVAITVEFVELPDEQDPRA